MALMFAICRPQPNWMPRNPKLMFQICQKPSLGFSIWGPRSRAILSARAILAGAERIRGVAEGEAQSAREGAVAGVAPDVDTARGIETMALDQDDAEPGQRLAAPADGRAVAVRAPGVIDLEPEQLVRPREDGLDLVRASSSRPPPPAARTRRRAAILRRDTRASDLARAGDEGDVVR